MESSRSDSIAEPHHNMHDYDTNNPPNSRLFVVCSKSFTEDDIREIFSAHGDIQDVYIIREKTPARSSKGVCFIKFYKSSDACKAMEELNGKHVKDSERPIKVLMAQSRHTERSWGYPSSGSHGAASRAASFATEEEQLDNLLRLFVAVDKKQTQEQIKDYFATFGMVDHVHILKDKETGESRGVAYVKFYRASHAALALEEAAPEYRAILADPRPPKGGPVAQGHQQQYAYSVPPFNSAGHGSYSMPTLYGSKGPSAGSAAGAVGTSDSVGHHSLHSGYQPPLFGYSSNGLSPSGSAPTITPLFPPTPTASAGHPHGALGTAAASNGAGLSAMLQMAACGDDGAMASWISPPHPGSSATTTGTLPSSPLLPSYEHINLACRTMGFSSCRIQAFVDPKSTESQLRGIFDLVPGLETFRLGGDSRKGGSNGLAYATYATSFAAYYAKEKLNGLEFPPGFRITTKMLDDNVSDGAGRYNNGSSPTVLSTTQVMNLQMSRAMIIGQANLMAGNLNTVSLSNGPTMLKTSGSPKSFQSSSAPMPTMGTGDSPQHQEIDVGVNGVRGYVYQAPQIHSNAVSASAESYPSFTSSSSGGSATNGPTSITKNSSTGNLQYQGSNGNNSNANSDHNGRKTKRGSNGGGNSQSNHNKRNNSTGGMKSNNNNNNNQSQQRTFVSSSIATAGSTGDVGLTNGTAATPTPNGSH